MTSRQAWARVFHHWKWWALFVGAGLVSTVENTARGLVSDPGSIPGSSTQGKVTPK